MLASFWFAGYFIETNPNQRDVAFFKKATSFYQEKKKGTGEIISPPPSEALINRSPIKTRKELLQDIALLENKILESYDRPQAELANSLSELSIMVKELELKVALSDSKINRTLLYPPAFRIVLSLYLEIPLKDLNDQNIKEANLSSDVWNHLLAFSQTNDFRSILLQDKLSKEELESHL